jgi:hypothetical protein
MNTKVMAGVLVGAMTLAASLGTAAEARHHHHHNNWNQAYNVPYGGYGYGNAYQTPYVNQNFGHQAHFNQGGMGHGRGGGFGGGHGHR